MPDGCENFPEFRVNSITAGQQVNPEIAMDEDGDFVVVWQDDNNNNDYYEILARGFDANGDEIIPEFTVNSVSSGQQLNPDISMTPGGNFVVVWEDDQDKNGFYQIYARGFRADGVELFHDITVNSVSSGQQYDPAVEVTQSGNFVVTWEDDQDENGSYQILARGFKANGTELFHDITVNSVSSGQQRNPDIAIDMNGNFAVVWEDDQDNNNYYNIYVRGFYANGNERFHDRIVNSVSAGQQFNPAIAMSDNGDFVVTWEDDQDENSWYQIYSRGFDINGIERFHDRAVNKESNGQQYLPAITMDDSGNFVAAWEDDMNKNTSYNILARGLDASGN
jgi:hypothetical protein